MRWRQPVARLESCPLSLFRRTSPLLFTLFLDLAGFSLVFPLYARLMDHYGAQHSGLLRLLQDGTEQLFGVSDPTRNAAFFGGLLAAAFSLLQFALTPFWGRMSDTRGRRRVLLITVSMSLGGYLLWVFAGRFELFVLSRLLCGSAAANISVASAAIADLTSREERTRGMGLMGASVGLGFLVGPALGGISTLLPMPALGAGWFALNEFSTAAALAALLSALNLYQLSRGFKESLGAHVQREALVRSANPVALFSRKLGQGVARINVLWLIFMSAFAAFESTLVFLLKDALHWDAIQTALAMVWLGITSVMMQGGIVRRLVPRLGEKRVALAGFALIVPGNILVAVVSEAASPVLLITGITLIALGVGCISPTLSALVSLRAPEHAQGLALGAFRSVGALGRAVGPFSAAWLYFAAGPGAPFALAAALLCVALVMLRRV